MTKEERLKLYAALAAPFPEEAIERTDGRVTGRGYSTTGIKYQYIVNRLNEVLGVGGFRVMRKVTIKEITTAKGRPAFEATCEVQLQLGEWKDNVFVPFAEAIGDGCHNATTVGDAMKGSFSNGFKKAAGYLGPGRQAYEGTLDDDNVPDEIRQEAPRPALPGRPGNGNGNDHTGGGMPGNGNGNGATHSGNGNSSAPRAAAAPRAPDRLTQKQLSAIWAIARRLGLSTEDVRERCTTAHGLLPEYLSRADASALIAELQAEAAPAGAAGAP